MHGSNFGATWGVGMGMGMGIGQSSHVTLLTTGMVGKLQAQQYCRPAYGSRLHRLLPTHCIMLAVAYRFLPWAKTRLNAPIFRNVAVVVDGYDCRGTSRPGPPPPLATKIWDTVCDKKMNADSAEHSDPTQMGKSNLVWQTEHVGLRVRGMQTSWGSP